MRKTLVLVIYILLSSTSAFAQASFYQGKTITIVAPTVPGGTPDLRVKAIVPLLRKYIPAKPTTTIEYTDGGGGRKGATSLFRNHAEPLRPEGLAKAIKEAPRDPEVVKILKNLSGAGPLPPR